VCTALVTAIKVEVPPPLLSRGWVFWGGHRTWHVPGVAVPPPLFSREHPQDMVAPDRAPPYLFREGCFRDLVTAPGVAVPAH
jgi:hypothetical protein